MRLLIVIQALIILVGAYYIYTLQQASSITGTDEVTEVSGVSEGPSEPEMSSGTNDEEGELEVGSEVRTGTSSGITGANDAGMEFPIPDDEAELQVR